MNMTVREGRQLLDLHELNKGIYLLRFESEGKVSTIRLIRD